MEATIAASPLDLIRLVAPTTPDSRLDAIASDARGFLYLVARLGVTGARAELAADLAAQVERVRRHSSLPVAVGFGISDADQARAVARMADGVVIGSALVERLERDGADGVAAMLGELYAAMVRAA
jgi:tryptophan synthase alpha chain